MLIDNYHIAVGEQPTRQAQAFLTLQRTQNLPVL